MGRCVRWEGRWEEEVDDNEESNESNETDD